MTLLSSKEIVSCLLASPLDNVVKYLQEREIQYTIRTIEPVSLKFGLSEQYYCLNMRMLNGNCYKIIAAKRQTGLKDAFLKGGVTDGTQDF